MPEASPIPLVVLSRQQDPVEIINSTLRNAGHPVHCTWIRDLADLADTLTQQAAQLLFVCLPDGDEVAAAIDARNRSGCHVPTILVRDSVAEADLVRAVDLGAQDVVTLEAPARLQAIASRELHHARLDRALSGTLASARQYRDQMKAFMSGSADAIAHVQEGIVVDVNPAWVELFGHTDPAALLGQPLMDLFDARSHAALKGALVATAQGRWSDHSLSTVARLPDGGELPLDIELERFEFEGEPAVRLKVAAQKRDLETLARQLDEALRVDSATGLLKRRVFLEQAAARVTQPLKGGLRAVAYVEPDKLAALESEHGPLQTEELLDALGSLLRDELQPGDLAGRVAVGGFALLVERGNARDLDAWLGHLLQRVSEHGFQVRGEKARLTCSVGVVPCNPQGEPLERPLALAVESIRSAPASRPGNEVLRRESKPAKPAVDEADRAWASQIKSALMANRFRLVQQPIASLVGEGEPMVDLVVRMLDEKGQEVLPSEFMAAAGRTDLMKNIDRWVVGAAMSFCAARKPHRVFVRLSKDSMKDQTLGTWLKQQLDASGVEPARVVFELTEELALANLKEARSLQGLLRALGIAFAIEHFGAAAEPSRLLERVPVDYVKIDGALMQGLANDRSLQEKVKALVEMARERNATTIAERVEDANTMAVLWQLGIEFVQGYFVNAPEQVTI